MTGDELHRLLFDLVAKAENEIVEFKEASKEYSFDRLGEYFSAISNEANLHSQRFGWLIFGVSDDRQIRGTNYRQGGKRGLRELMKEVADHTPNRLTFLDIHELYIGAEGKRVIMFQIPAAVAGTPTSWNGHLYGRDNASLVALSVQKQDAIRAQAALDWSKRIVPGANMGHLDPEAILHARSEFYKKNKAKETLVKEAKRWDDSAFLNKVGLTIDGKITNTALLLVGKTEAEHFFDGFIPEIVWGLYGSDGHIRAYEHIHIPFVLAVDKAYAKIRNLSYQYMTGQTTLFPETVDMYDQWSIRELLHNCIAHQDYTKRGKIYLREYEDRLVFTNEGGFLPKTIEKVLEPFYTPLLYRNAFLANAMTNINMIDAMASGIRRVYQIQIDRYFPMPDYDLSDPEQVRVTVSGRIIDSNYTKLLYEESSLDITTVFLLDRVQKKLPIAKQDIAMLRKRGLVEGRAPRLYVSGQVARITGDRAQYIRNRGQKDDFYMEKILEYIAEYGSASLTELRSLLMDMLPDLLSIQQKEHKIHNLLTKLRQRGSIMAVAQGEGKRKNRWVISSDDQQKN